MDFFDSKTRNLILGVGGLLALLTAGYYAVLWIRRSLVENDVPDGDELINPLRDAYRKGSMGTDEFERIQAMLGGDRPKTLEDELLAARKRRTNANRDRSESKTPAEGSTEPSSKPRKDDSDGLPRESD